MSQPFADSLETLDHRGRDNTITVGTNVEEIVAIF
jgi:hypothetical protein